MKKLTTILILGIFTSTGCVTLPELDKKAELSNSQEKTRNYLRTIINKARFPGLYYAKHSTMNFESP